MISILAQERLLGAALGSAFSGIVIFEHRRRIHECISKSQAQAKEPIFERESRKELAHLWNKSWENGLRSLIQAICPRGW